MSRITLGNDFVVLIRGDSARVYTFVGDPSIRVGGRPASLYGEGGLAPVTPGTVIARKGVRNFFKIGQQVVAPDGAMGTIQPVGEPPVKVNWK